MWIAFEIEVKGLEASLYEIQMKTRLTSHILMEYTGKCVSSVLNFIDILLIAASEDSYGGLVTEK